MSIKFVSHEEFPEDQYTKELVYLELNVPARVAFIRKQSKNGGRFWSVANIAVTKGGSKAYYETYLQDSSFLEKDIKKFLDGRSWANKKAFSTPQTATAQYTSEDIPF